VSRLQEGLKSGKSASIAQIIQLIQELGSRSDFVPIDQLASLVSRDLATMTRVISAANTIGYNPRGIEVRTVSQAIQTIGLERVRSIALGTMLVRNAEGADEDRRIVASRSLVSGLLAQTVLEQRRTEDPEQGFVCASLRNYGELLLVNFLPQEYREARALEPIVGWDIACRQVFGMTGLEAGRVILQGAHLPTLILDTLRPVTLEMINSKALSSTEVVMLNAEFAARWCEQVPLLEEDPTDLAGLASQLALRYGRTLAFAPEEWHKAIKQTKERVRSLGDAKTLKAFASVLVERLLAFDE
jgi:HD-like signal output (HDOD) protein